MVGSESQLVAKPSEGERFGKYIIYGKIAAGGMAAVYLGRERLEGGKDRWVAIKRVHAHLATRRDVVQMFLNEAKIVSRLEHENICGIVDYGEEDESPYIVMRYLHGAALSGLLRRLVDAKQPLPVDMMAYIAACVCDGLHFAHEATGEDGAPIGLVHRDISPQNIFITFDGKVTLLDFGVAKASGYSGFTRTGHIKGKYAYMSPEQVEASPLDRRSDVFSLGIVLWESLAGRHLFRRKRHIDTLRAIANADVSPIRMVNPNVPQALEQIVLRALEGDRRMRYQTAKAMGVDLRAYLARTDPKMGAERLTALMASMFPDRRHPSELQGVVTQPEILALVTETGGAKDPVVDPEHEDDVVQLRAPSLISDGGKSDPQPVTMPDGLSVEARSSPLGVESTDTVKPEEPDFAQRPLARADSELRDGADSTRTDLEAEAAVPRMSSAVTGDSLEAISSSALESISSVEAPRDDAGSEPTLNDSTGLLVAQAMKEAEEKLRAENLERTQEEFEDATLQLPHMQGPVAMAALAYSPADPRATIPDQPLPSVISTRDATLGVLRAIADGPPSMPQIVDPASSPYRPRVSNDTMPISSPSSPALAVPPQAQALRRRAEGFNPAVWIMVLVVLAAGLGAYAVVVKLVSTQRKPQQTASSSASATSAPRAKQKQPAPPEVAPVPDPETAPPVKPIVRPSNIELPDEAAGVKSPRAVTPAKRARARELEALARKSQSTGDVVRAEKLFIECVKLAALPTCHRSLGAIYAQNGDRDRAIAHYSRYLELAPEAVDAAHIRRLVEQP